MKLQPETIERRSVGRKTAPSSDSNGFDIHAPATDIAARRQRRVIPTADDLFAANEEILQRPAAVKAKQTAIRVLFLTPHYPPDVAATGQLVADLAEDLVSAGHEAVVIASRPSYTGQADSRYKLLQREIRNGVEIHWLGVPVVGRRGIWSRLFPFAGYFFAAIVRAVFVRRIDIVFAQSTPPLLAGLLGALLTLVPKRRFVYNLQDVYPELGQALGVLGDGALTRLSKRVESRLRRRADLITVLATDMRDKVLSSDPGLTNIRILPNWADSDQINPVSPSANAFRVQHGLTDRFVVMYSGNLGRAHGVEILPEVAELLSDLDDLVLLIVGEGAAKESVEAGMQARAIKNVLFLPYQPKETLSNSLSAADVSLILQRHSAAGLVVPSKLYGILASGRPTVAAVPDNCEVARVLREEQVGIVVAPESALEIAEAIRSLYLDAAQVDQLGHNARSAAVTRYDRKIVTGRYIQLLRTIATQ